MSKEKDSGAKGREEPKDEQDYTPANVKEMKEAKDEKDSFKKGGHVAKKRKHGGHVDGHKPAHRMDKRARGGRMSGGHSPFSMAENVKGRPGGKYDGTTDKEDD